MNAKNLFDEYVDLLALADLLDSDRVRAIESILTKPQQTALEAVHAELDDKIEQAKSLIKKARKAFDQAIIESGEGMKIPTHTASLVKGRVKWDTEMLEKLAVEYPEILNARSNRGKPYVVVKVRK